MAGECHILILDVLGQTFLVDHPQFDLAVFRRGSQELVVEWREHEVRDGALMAFDEGNIGVKSFK